MTHTILRCYILLPGTISSRRCDTWSRLFLSPPQKPLFIVVNHILCYQKNYANSIWVNNKYALERRGFSQLTRTKKFKLNCSGYQITPLQYTCWNLLLYKRSARNFAHLFESLYIFKRLFYWVNLRQFLLIFHIYLYNSGRYWSVHDYWISSLWRTLL